MGALANIRKEEEGKRKISDNASFLLSNNAGGYFSLSGTPIIRYQGCFFAQGFELYKAIEQIKPVSTNPVAGFSKRFWCIERKRQGLNETFFLPKNYNTLVYETGEESEFELLLDIRKAYDTRSFGKNYEIKQEGKYVIIKFTKTSDSREDSKQGIKEYEFFIAITGLKIEMQKTEQWQKQEYEYDKKRGSTPSEIYVYNALKIKSKQTIISFAKTKEEAIKEAQFILNNLDYLKKEQQEHAARITHCHHKNIKDNEISVAHKCALNSIDCLTQKIEGKKGIYAGLWWFFQYWARDEAISLKSLILEGRVDEAKEIIFRILKNIKNGELQNKHPAENADALSPDAIGWWFKRIKDIDEKNLWSSAELEIIYDTLKETINALIKKQTHEMLAMNNAKETWMDSLERKGARIEMQALRLNMYKILKEFAKKIGKDEDCVFYEEVEKQTKQRVRELFWNGKILADGLDDWTIRPNIFIAHYAYPELLSVNEWKTCFKHALKQLWLDWGGLSTIDKKNPDFHSTSTGENPASYHTGDSWYWINNLAATCMNRLDKKLFQVYIKKILSASTDEILHSGMIGHHAELSSAEKQSSEGCLAQAWSAAMYIELIDELF